MFHIQLCLFLFKVMMAAISNLILLLMPPAQLLIRAYVHGFKSVLTRYLYSYFEKLYCILDGKSIYSL